MTFYIQDFVFKIIAEFELEMKFNPRNDQIEKVDWFDDNFSVYQVTFTVNFDFYANES